MDSLGGTVAVDRGTGKFIPLPVHAPYIYSVIQQREKVSILQKQKKPYFHRFAYRKRSSASRTKAQSPAKRRCLKRKRAKQRRRHDARNSSRLSMCAVTTRRLYAPVQRSINRLEANPLAVSGDLTLIFATFNALYCLRYPNTAHYNDLAPHSSCPLVNRSAPCRRRAVALDTNW